MKRMRKIKYDGEKVTIQYERLGAGEPDVVTLECGDPPTIDFTQALDRLKDHVAEICEIAVPHWTKGLDVRGVSLSYSKDEIMGATITALKVLAKAPAPLVVNTPHKPSEPTSEQMPTAHCLTSQCVSAIRRLETAAWDYVDGVREQGDLFSGAVVRQVALA